jgi:hypothetical protein
VSFKGLLLFSFLLTIAVSPAFAQYSGDDDDGSSVAAICVNTLDGVDQFSFGTLTGSSTFCDFSSEGYNILVNNPPQDIQYVWSIPSDATILSGNGSPSITVAFGNTPGTVSVTVITVCTSQTFNMAVTNGACSMYQGDTGDGFSQMALCTTMLDGTPLVSIAPSIVGSVNFCEGSTESYSIQVDNAPADIYYNWNVPAGSVVQNGQGTSTAVIFFASAPGNVTVDVITFCGTTTRSLAVSSMNCSMYDGGDNDGFSKSPSCSITLNGAPQFSVVGIQGSTTFCEFGTEGFNAATINAPADSYYDWTVPADATIVTGQGTANVTVLFGNTSGTVSVNIITDCSTQSPTPFAVTSTICSFYSGGDNDGFSSSLSCATMLDGTNALVVSSIVGSTTFCDFATESYTIPIQGASPETTITWSVPAGATIVSGQGTATVLIAFSNTGGNVSVDVTNLCGTVSRSLPVATTNCQFYAGGDNDGFSMANACVQNLNGGDAFIPGLIVGSAASCEFATETYSITVANAPVNITYVWSVPAGASIISGQGTTSILVAFGNTSGTVSVQVSNDCTTKTVNLPVTVANCIFYAGGNNDGFSVIQSCTTKLDGTSAFIAGPIVGSSSSCEFSTEQYSITVAGTLPTTVYVWTVPAGASIVSGQGTNTILVAFGNTTGNVAVAVSNECETKNISLPVTVANCIFYAGGNNDGFSLTQICTQNLNGGAAFVPGAIVGSSTFCNFSSESFSITVAGATATTGYLWSVPAGASIVSGQGTSTILVSFGTSSGNIAVAVSNDCQTINVSLPVTGGSCIFYAGGNNDGFSVTTVLNIPLPVALVSFDAEVENNIVTLKWETLSEFENDFFLVERSKDGKTFERLTKVDGAGTSTAALKYQVRDTDPYHGTSYYRLSQTDYDGSIEYFRVVSVKIETFYEVTKLYPNPVMKDERLHVDYFAEEDGPVKISVIDPAGRSTEGQMVDAKAGVNLFEFTPHFQSSGVHVIVIRSRDKATVLRLVVL